MKNTSTKSTLSLRQRAEAQVRRNQPEAGPVSPEEAVKLLQELQVYQRELEIQNEDLRATQLELARSRDRLALLFHRAPVGYVVIDPAGLILEANATFGEMLGLDVSQLLNRGLSQWLDEKDRPIFLARFPAWARDPTAKTIEGRMVGTGGRSFQVSLSARHEADGFGGRLLVTVTDITPLHRAMKALEHSRHEWALTVDASPDLIYVVDRNLRLTRVNQALAQRWGKPREEIIGRACYEICGHPTVCESCPQKWVMEEKTVHTRQVRFRQPEGIFQVSCAPFTNERGEILGTIHVAHDLTPLLEEQQQRIELEKQLHQSQKLESIGVLAGGIAHDFNNILQAISGHAELALADLPEDSETAQSLRTILESSAHAASICDQMLTFAGQQTHHMRPLSLAELVNSLHPLLRVSISKNVTLSMQLGGDPAFIHGDPALLKQVVMNLVINASEACEGREGHVELELAEVPAAPPITETWVGEKTPEGAHVRLVVRDNGIGIDEQQLPRIFDPFYTTKFTGRGLGLAAVLGIVKSHRGALQVASVRNQGTTFTLVFPTSPLPTPPVETPTTSSVVLQGSGLVLAVDDEPSLLLSLVTGLNRYGFSVIVAHDGTEALQQFHQHVDELSAIVLDMTMPHVSGPDALKHIRSTRPDLPVVLASGYNEMEAWKHLPKDAHTEFLHKPYRIRDLCEKLIAMMKAPA